MLVREYVRWVSKALFEGFGRGGCISRVRGVSFSGGEDATGFSALGEEESAITEDRISAVGFSDGGEEGTSRGGRFVTGREEKSAVAGSRALSGDSSNNGEEDTCNRGRFALGGEACCVGEGEVEANGRLR